MTRRSATYPAGNLKQNGGAVGRPSVTLAIIAYNHAKYVVECLDSAAAQTYENCRMIILDDASTDDSVAVIRSWIADRRSHARFIAHDVNRGLCRGLNEVRQLIDSDYVCFISADDRMVSHRVERQVALLEHLGPEYAFCYSDMMQTDADGKELRSWYDKISDGQRTASLTPSGDVFASLLKQNTISSATVMIRSSALLKAGPYDESLRAEDYDMWLRLSRQNKVAYLPEILIYRREVDGSLGRTIRTNRRLYLRERVHILAKHVDNAHPHRNLAARQLGHYSKQLYMLGEDPRRVVPYLELAARYDSKRTTSALLLAARLKVPGSAFAWARRIVRRLFGRSNPSTPPASISS